MQVQSPVETIIAKNGVFVLDGALATELEHLGADLDHPLWSARVLQQQPDLIRRVHRAYLDAGADCLTTASYQATFDGFATHGCDKNEAARLLQSSVSIAREVADEFAALPGGTERPRPVVAASIGSYGAFLADGSEYRGDYGVPAKQLREFHLPRWELLAASGADLLACETIPSSVEAEVLLDLLAHWPGVRAWLSFSCRDDQRICDGTPLRICAEMTEQSDQVLAVGVNCTPPRLIAPLIEQVRLGAPNKPVIVYPNSGQNYDVAQRKWLGRSDPTDFGQLARRWHACGATLIGGCCQTGPQHIRAIRAALSSPLF